ncbi:MAG: 1-acyl-sn-glycerol-3-phosphate acyltransferase [Zhongshania sp.]|jgi:1-acyl-sn-glycerol-3-phosphate acyltransferase
MALLAHWILVIRSALFFAGVGLITIFISISGMAFTWFLSFNLRGRYFVLGNKAIIFWLRICCGVKTEVRGSLPPDGLYVAMAKHQSQWETFYLQWYLFPVVTVVKLELFKLPFFGWALKFINAIGIDRSNPRAAMRQILEQGINRLENQSSVLIFPEGTRTMPGVRGRYARSGSEIAIAAGVPVIPIAHNAGGLWPPKSLLIKSGTITLVIGQPISTLGRNSRDVTKEVEDWIEQRCADLIHI